MHPSRLATRSPFNLEATVLVLQRRPANLVDVWKNDRYLRVLQAGDDLVLVEVQNRGTIDLPDLRWSIRLGTPSRATKIKLGQILRTVLGLDLDVEPTRRLAESERRLRPTAVALRGMRPPRFPEIFRDVRECRALPTVEPRRRRGNREQAGRALWGAIGVKKVSPSTPFQRRRRSPTHESRRCGRAA